MTHKIHFDPLYGAVAFRAERLGLEDFWSSLTPLDNESTAGVLAENLDNVLNSYELGRLNYLKQAGFSWLIYPSATHTRYAHSLGCWYLGEQAMDSVQVLSHSGVHNEEGNSSRSRFLIDWLRSSNLQEEFMLALLLHDVGHFPFSHVLEMNPDYSDISHEAVALQYILGEGPVFTLLRDKVSRSMQPAFDSGLMHLAEALGGMRKTVLDVNVVCALITGDNTYVEAESEDVQLKTSVLQELVSGVVDLDRIDHYHRDSYSMGLRIGYANPIALLSGMELCPGADRKSCWVRLSDTGIMQAIAMLSTRDMLIKNVFDYETNVSYAEMLNFAVSQVIRSREDLRLRILTWTDEELLSFLLENTLSPIAASLASRILARQPYVRVARYRVSNPDYDSVDGLERVKQWLRDNLQAKLGIETSSSDILIRYSPRIIGKREGQARHSSWFDMDKLQTLDGRTLAKHDMYERQVRFLVDQFTDLHETVQFFASTEKLARSARTLMNGQNMLDERG